MENKTDITQYVLKVRQIALLLKYIKWILGVLSFRSLKGYWSTLPLQILFPTKDVNWGLLVTELSRLDVRMECNRKLQKNYAVSFVIYTFN